MTIFKMSNSELIGRLMLLAPTVELAMDKLGKSSIGDSIKIDLDIHSKELRELVEEMVKVTAKDKEWKIRSKWVEGSLLVWRVAELTEALRAAVGNMTMVERLVEPFEENGVKGMLKNLTESDMPYKDKSLGYAAVLYKMAGVAVVGSLAEAEIDDSGIAHLIDCINANVDNLATAIDNVLGISEDRGLFPFPVAES